MLHSFSKWRVLHGRGGRCKAVFPDAHCLACHGDGWPVEVTCRLSIPRIRFCLAWCGEASWSQAVWYQDWFLPHRQNTATAARATAKSKTFGHLSYRCSRSESGFMANRRTGRGALLTLAPTRHHPDEEHPTDKARGHADGHVLGCHGNAGQPAQRQGQASLPAMRRQRPSAER